MTALHRDLSAPEIWQRSFERSRRRRAVTPKLRRQVVRRKGASTAMAAAMLAGPGAQFAGAQTTSEGSGSGQTPSEGSGSSQTTSEGSGSGQTTSEGSGSDGAGVASESPANRAIAGGDRAAQVMLSVGSAGEAVKAVQGQLGIEATGVFGEGTEQAVRSFQGRAGLAVDGVVGLRTWAALFSGSGTGPAADTGNSAPVLVPATGGTERRTSFAVRRAADDELKKLNVEGADLAKPKDEGAGLAAIEFRLPDDESSEDSSASSDEPSARTQSSEASGSGDDGVRSAAASEAETASDSTSSGSSGSGDDPDRPVSDGDSGDSEEPSGGSSGSEPSRDSGGEEGAGSDSGAANGGACSDRLRWPTKGRHITSGYGPRWGRTHHGSDIDTDGGEPIYAAACGVITLMESTGESGGYGNYICIKHTDRFVTCYAHLSGFADVRVGDYVRAGQTIGDSGCTGTCYGEHLHFETRRGTPYRDSDYSSFNAEPYLNDGRGMEGESVRSSSRDVAGADVQEREEPQARQVSTANREPAAERRSAVAIATDSDGGASKPSGERAAPTGRYTAAESEPAEPTEEKRASRASEADAGEADAGEQAAEGSTEPEPRASEEAEPPSEETASEEPAPATEESSATGEESVAPEEGEPVAEEGVESSTESTEDTGSNGSDPSTGGSAEEPSGGDDEASSGADASAEDGSGSAGSVGDAGSGASAEGSTSVESDTTATSEAPASTGAPGSGSIGGSGQAETTTATAPGESAAVSANGSTGATAKGDSETSTATGEGGSSGSGDASTEAYFSEEEESEEEIEPLAGD